MKEVKVGIIGFGTVGAGVAANILGNSDVIAKRANVKLVLSRIADLDITTDRGVKIPEGVLTTDGLSPSRKAAGHRSYDLEEFDRRGLTIPPPPKGDMDDPGN